MISFIWADGEYLCGDTIFNDPGMTLGSYVKGPNNMICREWVWKGLPLDAGLRSGPDFMRAHIKVGSDCIAKPYIDIVWRVWLLGISPRSITFSPYFLPFFQPPCLLALFPFYTSIHFPFFIYVSVFPCLGVITRPINPYVRVVGKGWIAWYGV